MYLSSKMLNNAVFTVAQPKKKEEPGIFSDDDDFLGGLGIEEKESSAPKARVNEDEEEDKPARSVMDKLLAKDSTVSKHLETKKERREFVLDKKYTQPNNGTSVVQTTNAHVDVQNVFPFYETKIFRGVQLPSPDARGY